ncbi:MAG: FtsW/RodA/SpoVE family cell cycle protein [Chitinophagales bacterium]|nr:FtsW/RodA/SpoVE family cell cycle protein [Chitinophagales bacterium]
MSSIFKHFQGDRLIWLVVFLLIGVSMLGIYSSTSTLAFRLQGGNTEYYVMKQFFYVAIGFGLMFITHLVDYRYYSRLAQILWLVSIPLLLYTMFFGTELNNANRWITIPLVGLTFQTSDLAKLALIMYLARQLSLKQENIDDFKESFLPILLPIIVTALLIVPDNLSTALIVVFTSIFVMFIGRVALRHIALLAGAGTLIMVLFFAILFVMPQSMLVGRTATWKHRVENFFDRSGNVEEEYQVLQSKIAIAKGGLVNLNAGGSDQKNFLPHPYSDFIYAIIIEEYGLLGGAIILMLYLFFLYRCIRIVLKAPKAFGAFLAVGLGIALVIQAMINMAVVVNLVPVTGVTLPLVSMGGSSAIFTSIAFGIILSVSRNVELQNGEESLEMAA